MRKSSGRKSKEQKLGAGAMAVVLSPLRLYPGTMA